MAVLKVEKIKPQEPSKKKGKKKSEKRASASAQLAEWREKDELPVVIRETDTDKTPVHATRFPKLDAHFGRGIREGAIIEIYGPEDSAKSSLAIALAADIQKAAKPPKNKVVILNFEGSHDYDWWRTLGLDTTEDADDDSKNKLIHLRPRGLEQGVGRGARLVETGQICCLIIDSVYAAEANDTRRQIVDQWPTGEGKGAGLGLEARQWGKAWTTLRGLFQDYGTVCIAVNQERELIEIGGPPRGGWSKPTTSPRGKALKFYAWVRMIARGKQLDAEKFPKAPDGSRAVSLKLIKNKTSKTGLGIVHLTLIRGEGFDLVSDLIDLSLECQAIQGKGGGNFLVEGVKLRGRDTLVEYLQKRSKLCGRLREKVQAHLLAKRQDDKTDDGDVDAKGDGDVEEA